MDCHVQVVTKDNKKVRLTISCYTFARANIAQEHALGARSSQALPRQAQAWDLTTLVNGIVSGEISRDLFKVVKTTLPHPHRSRSSSPRSSRSQHRSRPSNFLLCFCDFFVVYTSVSRRSWTGGLIRWQG